MTKMSFQVAHISEFAEIKRMIENSKRKALVMVDAETIDLYWNVGCYVRDRLKKASWGDGVVVQLSSWLRQEEPGITGFTVSNIHRMVKFVDTYSSPEFLTAVGKYCPMEKVATVLPLLSGKGSDGDPKGKVATPLQLSQLNNNQKTAFVSDLLRTIGWSSHLLILAGKRTPEERLFYLLLAQRERLSFRELQRQIRSSMYERTLAGELLATPKNTDIQQNPAMIFRDSYSLELLGIPIVHDEKDVRKSIVSHLKEFFLEFGRDFCFVGEEYKLQVGMKDFFVDLVFFHRELRCLIAVELKSREFLPRDLGQLEFYLEALDRQVKKEWENPSIGILLCKEKDDAVVEYALNRSASPAMIAEYTRLLPQKEVVRARLQELLDQTGSPLPEIEK